MILVLLSGNSVRTKEWIESVEEELKNLFESTHIQYYNHWETNEKIIDINCELNELSKYLKDKKDYVIFGKSAGIVLALKGISEGKIFPKKCMFVGTPVSWCKENNILIENWAKDYKTPTFFIQKTKDPAIYSEELKDFLNKNKVKNFKLIEIPGGDHHYENLKELKKLMEELINENNL